MAGHNTQPCAPILYLFTYLQRPAFTFILPLKEELFRHF